MGEMKSKLKSNGGSNISFDVKVLYFVCFTLNHLLWFTRVLSFKHFILKYFQTDGNQRATG